MKVKGLIPAAGHGTRLAPLSRIVPKELFPVGRIAAIHHVIDEGIRAGIGSFGIVIRPGKESLRQYVSEIIGDSVEIEFIEQQPQLGVGDALLRAASFADGAPVAVLFPDMLFHANENPTADLLASHAANGRSVVGLVHHESEDMERFGTLEGERTGEGTYRIDRLANEYVEAKHMEPGVSGAGRLVLNASLFDYPRRDDQTELNDGELLTWLAGREQLQGQLLPYRAYDCGTVLGYADAVHHLASEHTQQFNQV